MRRRGSHKPARKVYAHRQATLAASVMETLERRQLMASLTSACQWQTGPQQSLNFVFSGLSSSVAGQFTLDDIAIVNLTRNRVVDNSALEFSVGGFGEGTEGFNITWPTASESTGRLEDGYYEVTVDSAGVPVLPGDYTAVFWFLNGDVSREASALSGVIDEEDFGVWEKNEEQSGSFVDGDADYSGYVDGLDWAIIFGAFGNPVNPPPTTPNFVDVTPNGADSMIIQWTPATGASPDGYRIYRSTDGVNFGNPIAEVAFVAGTQNYSYTDHGLTDGKKYWYRTRAFTFQNGNSAATNKDWAVTALPAPRNVRLTDVRPTSMNLLWDADSTTHTGFHVFRAEGSQPFNYAQPWLTVSPTARSQAITTNVQPGIEYHFAVRAVNAATLSAPSATASAVAATQSVIDGPSFTTEGSTVSFVADLDRAGIASSIQAMWRASGPGIDSLTGFGETFIFKVGDEGVYTIELIDLTNGTVVETRTLDAANAAPRAPTIKGPVQGPLNEATLFLADTTDPAGAADPLSYQWRCFAEKADGSGFVQLPNSGTAKYFLFFPPGLNGGGSTAIYTGNFRIEVTATDDEGASATSTRNFFGNPEITDVDSNRIDVDNGVPLTGQAPQAIAVDDLGRIYLAAIHRLPSVPGSLERFPIIVARFLPTLALDSSFNGTGYIQFNIEGDGTNPSNEINYLWNARNGNEQTLSLAWDSQDRLIVGGYAIHSTDAMRFGVVRINNAMTNNPVLDTMFNNNAKNTFAALWPTLFQETGWVESITVDASDRILVAGSVVYSYARAAGRTPGPGPGAAIVRLAADGTLGNTPVDPFGTPIVITVATPTGPTTVTINGVSLIPLSGFESGTGDGYIHSSASLRPSVGGVVVHPDGSIYVGVEMTLAPSPPPTPPTPLPESLGAELGLDIAIVKLTANGVPDASFGQLSTVAYVTVSQDSDLHPLPSSEGAFVVPGARLASFIPWGTGTGDTPFQWLRGLTLTPDGRRLVLAGIARYVVREQGTPWWLERGAVGLYDIGSSPGFDNSFSGDGRVDFDLGAQFLGTAFTPGRTIITSVLADSNGIFVAGSASDGSTKSIAIARLNNNGTFDTSFGPVREGAFTPTGVKLIRVASPESNGIQLATSIATTINSQNRPSIILGGYSSDTTAGQLHDTSAVLVRIKPEQFARFDLTAALTQDSRVQLSWGDPNILRDRFVVERQTIVNDLSVGSFTELAVVLPNELTFVDTTAQPATTYEYRVRALRGNALIPVGESNIVRLSTPPADTSFVLQQTVLVPVDGTPISSPVALDPGAWYRIRASGYFTLGNDQNGQAIYADAEYAYFAGGGYPRDKAAIGGPYHQTGLDYGLSISTLPNGALSGTVKPPSWGAPNTDTEHTYTILYQLPSGTTQPTPVNFRFHDDYYRDNQGFGTSNLYKMRLEIYRAIPGRPDGLRAEQTDVGSKSVTVSWDQAAESGLTYVIQRRGESPDPFVDIALAPGGASSYVDEDILFNRRYHYRILARSVFGDSTPSNEVIGAAVNLAPIITRIPSVTAYADVPFQFQIAATDPEGGALSYAAQETPLSLTSAGFAADATGLISTNWTPSSTQVGNSTIFRVTVTDVGGIASSTSFRVFVAAHPGNVLQVSPASASVSPIDDERVNLSLSAAIAGGSTGITYAWSTSRRPTGQTAEPEFDETLNATSATPQVRLFRAGLYQFAVVVRHGPSGQAQERLVNYYHVPVIQTLKITSPGPSAVIRIPKGGVFEVRAIGIDQYGQPAVPEEVFWQPTVGASPNVNDVFFDEADPDTARVIAGDTAGTFYIYLKASDAPTAQILDQRTFTVTNATNTAPVIREISRAPGPNGTILLSALVVDDSPSTALQYTWTGTGPTGMVTFSSPPNGTPAGQTIAVTLPNIGNYTFAVTVADPVGASASSSIQVINSPTPTSIRITSVGVGGRTGNLVTLGFQLTLTAQVLDQFGRVIAAPSEAGFAWSVNGGTANGTLSSTTGQAVTYTPPGNAGTFSVQVTISGVASIATSATTLQVHAIAPEPPRAEIAGGNSVRADQDLDIILSIEDRNPEDTITYRVELVSLDPSVQPVVLKSGTGPIGAYGGSGEVIGQVRPTMLRNGVYRLQIVDGASNQKLDEQTITIDTELKAGNLALPLTDATFRLGDIDFPLTRVYDSANADRLGDLGPGWRFELPDVMMRTNLAENGWTGSLVDGRAPFREGQTVWITLPGGETHAFTFSPVPASITGGPVGGANPLRPYIPAFISVDGKAQLNVEKNYRGDDEFPVRVRRRITNGIVDYVTDLNYLIADGFAAELPYNPALNAPVGGSGSSPFIFSNFYELALEDGRKYRIDATTGRVTRFTDRNGRILKFNDSAGKLQSVELVHLNASGNEVVDARIVVERPGNLVRVGYPGLNTPVNMNLPFVEYELSTDSLIPVPRLTRSAAPRNDGETARWSSYQYLSITDNLLTKLIDPRDVEVLSAQYNAATRELTKLIDATGKAATSNVGAFDGESAHDSADDLAGNKVEYQYDAFGNPVREVRHVYDESKIDRPLSGYNIIFRKFNTGVINTYAENSPLPYSHQNQLTHESEPVFVVAQSNPFADSLQPVVWRVITSYLGRLIDHPITNNDDGWFKPGPVSKQRLGVRVGFEGDPNEGRTNEIAYPDDLAYQNAFAGGSGDPFELPSSTTDADGNVTEFIYTTATLDAGVPRGLLKASRNALNEVTRNEYNAAGQVLRSWRYRNATTTWGSVLPQDAWLVVENTYYDSGPERGLLKSSKDHTSSNDPTLKITRHFAYDAALNPIAEYRLWKPPAGDVTPNRWVRTDTFFDGAGRVIESAEGHYLDAGGDGVFDPADGSPRLANPALRGAIAGTLQRTLTVYNLGGQVEQAVDPMGGVTAYRYDVRGNLVQTIYPDGSTAETAYDAMGRAFWQTERWHAAVSPAGPAATHSVFDAQGRVIETRRYKSTKIIVTTAAGVDGVYKSTAPEALSPRLLSVSKTKYDARGRVEQSTDVTGATTAFTYYNDGRAFTTTVDKDGNPATTADRAVTTQKYAARQSSTQDASGVWTKTVTDSLGRVIQAVSLAKTETNVADDLLVETFYGFVVDPAALTAAGLTVDAAVPAGAYTFTTTLERRPPAPSSAPARSTQFFDRAGRLVAVQQPAITVNGNAFTPVWRYAYDAQGNLIEQIDPRSGVANATGTHAAAAIVTRFKYDASGRRTERTLPDGQSESWTYDGHGNVKSHLSFDARLTFYAYDYDADFAVSAGERVNQGRLVETRHYDSAAPNTASPTFTGQRVHYTYDALGRQIELKDDAIVTGGAASSTRLTRTNYDPVTGQPASVQTWLDDQSPGSAAPAELIAYAYHSGTGRMLGVETGNVTTNYTHDPLGRLTLVSATRLNGANVGSVAATYTYDLTGALTTETLSNGLTTAYGYDDYGRLGSVAVTRDDPNTTAVDQYKVFGQELALLPSGQRDTATEKRYTGTGATTPFSTVVIDWGYDALNRLTSERRDVLAGTNVTGAIDAAGEYYTTYTLDAVGNRLQKTLDDFENAKDETITSSYLNANGSLNRNDWLLSETSVKTTPASTTTTAYAYNANGSTTSKSVNGSVAETYTWDRRGRMTSAAVGGVATNYKYDAVNNRTQKQTGATTTRYIIDAQNPTGYAKAIEERNATGAPTKSYVLGLDIIAEQDGASAAVEYLVQDARGFTRILAAPTGLANANQLLDMDAFGNALNYTNATAGTEWIAPDGRTDVETGLTYQINRYSNRLTGKFNSFDFNNDGDPSNPATFHKFVLGNANPVYYLDASGNVSLTETLGMLSIRPKFALAVISISAAILGGSYAYNTLAVGNSLTTVQGQKLNRAIHLLRVEGYNSWADLAAGVTYKIDPELGDWGQTRFAYRTVLLRPDSLQLDDRLLAALILHETVHVSQWVIGTEAPAYQVQSDYMRSAHLDGRLGEVLARIGATSFTDRAWLRDQADHFLEFATPNAAVRR